MWIICIYPFISINLSTYLSIYISILNIALASHWLQRSHFVLSSSVRSTGRLIQWATMHSLQQQESIRAVWLGWREGWDSLLWPPCRFTSALVNQEMTPAQACSLFVTLSMLLCKCTQGITT